MKPISRYTANTKPNQGYTERIQTSNKYIHNPSLSDYCTVLYIPVLSVNAKGFDFALKAEKYNIQRYYLLIYFYTFHQETVIRLCNGSISNLVKMQSATTSVEKSKI